MKGSPKSKLVGLAVILVLSAIVIFWQSRWIPGDGWGFPRDVSVDGYRIDRLIIVTGIFTTLLFIITCGWIAYSCWKHRGSHEAEYDHGTSRASVMGALVLSALIFFVVDGNLFVNSVIDTTEVFWNWKGADEEPDVVRIEINARQWAWDVRYHGPDGRFNTADDVVTLNDVRIPTGRPVLVQLAATDVIHSFYLPNLRVKQDAVPGVVNPLRFEADETGTFEIACAQHCGMAHYLMKGTLTILEPNSFDAWIAQGSAVGAQLFDPMDTGSHWGWPWQEM